MALIPARRTALVALAASLVLLIVPAVAKEMDEDRPLGSSGGAIQVDPFTGVATTSIPIEVPSGRNGLQPNLALTYESAGGNGWLGMGWKLELGAIERQTKWGVLYPPTATDEQDGKVYVIRLNGVATELVPAPAPAPSDEYRARVEGGFLRIKKVSGGTGGWEVTDQKGTKYIFGSTSATRMANPADTTQIFRWALEKVVDRDGNYLTATYWGDTTNNQLYLDQLQYGGNDGSGGGTSLAHTNTMKFWRDDGTRPDQADLYMSNYRIKTKYRLKTIEVKANGNSVRAYKFGYNQSGTTASSVLSTVQQFGKDATLDGSGSITNEFGAVTKLPTVTFTQTNPGNTFSQTATWSSEQNSFYAGFSQATSQPFQFPGDFNGDGKTDFMYWTSGGWRVLIGNGSSTGFDSSALWSTETDAYYLGFANGTSQPFQFPGDLNGDGKTDFLYWGSTGWRALISNSNGTGFNASVPWSTEPNVLWAGFSGYSSQPFHFLADLNGDGKADFLYWSSGWRALIGNGSGFNASVAWSTEPNVLWAGYSGYSSQPFHLIGDFNGDGKSDFMYYKQGVGWHILRSTGSSFAASSLLTTDSNALWTYTSTSSQPFHFLGDFNGDGKTDFMHWGVGGLGWRVLPSQTVPTDYLQLLSNGLSGATTLTYDTSANDTSNRVPFALQRVKTLTTCDNWNSGTSTCAGTAVTTNYAYNGGFYHAGARDIRGVAQTTVTGPADGGGQRTITETSFHRGSKVTPVAETESELLADPKAYTKGLPYKVVVKDQVGTVLTETLTEYYDDTLDGTSQTAPFFTPAKDLITKVYTGGAVAKEMKASYTYGENPQYGHVTREDHYGDATNNNAVTSDDKTIVRTYGNNSTDWLLGFPTSEILYAGIGTTTRVAQTDFYYDGTTSCSTASTNQTPTKGHLTRTVRDFFNGTSTHGDPEIRIAYDNYGNRTCSRDARGNTSMVTYDSATSTFPLTTTGASPASLVTSTAYYGVNGETIPSTGFFGRVKSVTDPNGRVTTHEYDALARKTKTTNPDGFYATTAYTNFGGGVGTNPATHQHVLVTNSLGHSGRTFFDGLGRSTTKTSTYTSGSTRETKTEYDVRGLVTRTSLPYFTGGTAYWRTPSYDAFGRVIQMMNPDNTVSKSCYADWTTVTVDPDGTRKRETKDAFGRVLKIEEYSATVSTCDTAAGSSYATTNYVYDVLGNLTSVTDAKGNISTMAYDSLSRKKSMHDPDMGDWSYLYDDSGNLIKQTDAKSQVLWFQYDELNRRRQKDFTTQKTLGSGDVVYSYDDTVTTSNRKGRLKQVADAATNVTFEYDVLGRITKSTKVLDSTTYVTTSAYDGLGRLTSVTYPSSPAKAVDYVYVGPYLEQVKDKAGDGTTTYVQYAGWNEMGQPGTATYNVGANQVVTTYTYQTASNATCSNKHTFRPCTVKTQNGANPAYLDLRYVFTNGGNVNDIYDTLASANDQHFTYDALDRVTLANGPYGTSGANASITYEYNEIGNLTKNTQLSATSYTYPTSGSSSVRPHAVSTAGGNTYTYDNNGNMMGGAGRTFTWNLENKPLTITQGGTTTTFVYDGDGGRVKKIVGSTTTRYISKLYECDNTNCSRFIYAGSARVATVAANGAIHFWHPDHLGSSTIITDSTGAKVQALAYYPYGVVRTNTSPSNPPIDVPYKYTGKELDNSTGLYYYEARYYEPALGRFISADTIVPKPTDPQEFNRYTYAGNNPLLYTDPTGRIKFAKFFQRAFGDWGTTALGLGIQIFGGPVFGIANFVAGGAVLTQSQSGRQVLTAEITAAAAITGAYALAPAIGSVAGGIAAGTVSGAANGYLLEGSLKGTLSGGLSGGIFGGIGGYYGNAWGLDRVLLNGLAGGVSAQVKGGSFLRGMGISLAVAGLTYANYEMRAYEWTLSSNNPANTTGESTGFFGDGHKLAGNRLVIDASGQVVHTDPGFFGGLQGGQGSFMGISYRAGSALDYVNEGFAGPHDFANDLVGWYDPTTGNAFQSVHGVYGEAMNVLNIGIVAPIAGAAMIPTTAYEQLAR